MKKCLHFFISSEWGSAILVSAKMGAQKGSVNLFVDASEASSEQITPYIIRILADKSIGGYLLAELRLT